MQLRGKALKVQNVQAHKISNTTLGYCTFKVGFEIRYEHTHKPPTNQKVRVTIMVQFKGHWILILLSKNL